jgi:hypothetical protein
LEGALQPLAWRASGTLAVRAATCREVPLGDVHARWDADLDRLRIPEIRLRSPHGEVIGNAVLPLRASVGGRIELRCQEFDVHGLAGIFAAPFPLEGWITGNIQAALPPTMPGRPREMSAAVSVQAGQLRIQGYRIDRLEGAAAYRASDLDYRFSGDLFAGRIHLEKKSANETRVRVEGARVARWAAAQHLTVVAQHLDGRVDTEVVLRHTNPANPLGGVGRFVLSDLRWDDTELADLILGDIVLSERELRLSDLSGTLGGGVLVGQVRFDLPHPERSRFRFSVDGAAVERLVAGWPELAGIVQGPVDLRLRGGMGREWRGSLDVALTRASVFGVDVAEARLPVEFAISAESGRGLLEIREGHAQVAQGRATVQASCGWDDETRLDGKIRFAGVSLRQILRAAGESGGGGGELSGRLDFAGQNLHGLEDLTADLDVALTQGQVLDLPVLRQIAPYIAPGQAVAAFQEGDLRARLARGLIRIERLRLRGSVIQAMLAGTITMRGQLDLEATANPGLLSSDLPIFRQLGLRIPANGPVPVELLAQATQFFSRRLVHLHIGGTVRSPTVRVAPLSRFTEEAARFFLSWTGR